MIKVYSIPVISSVQGSWHSHLLKTTVSQQSFFIYILNKVSKHDHSYIEVSEKLKSSIIIYIFYRFIDHIYFSRSTKAFTSCKVPLLIKKHDLESCIACSKILLFCVKRQFSFIMNAMKETANVKIEIYKRFSFIFL